MKSCLLLLVLSCALSAADLVLVANPDHAGVTLSKRDVADIYSGRMSKWPDGAKIAPVYLKGGAVHDEFLATYVGKNDAQFIANWKKMVFTGKSSMPDGFASEAEVIARVKATPGAIGYVAKANAGEGVVVIPVE